ncbi:MAG: molybdenum cofactor biosynthesis protein [Holdemanella sp.]|nr:molybdenum cofactor biosynthesis protein [Holdemanella sp.]
MEGIVKAVCISTKKGTEKQNIHACTFIKDFGLENDAHGGNWHRQVSLLNYEAEMEFSNKVQGIHYGVFGENLLVSGIDFKSLPVGTILKCNDVILELTQIGKECHSGCNIFKQVGDCIMPRLGVFAKVIQGGTIQEGDCMVVEGKNSALRAAVITMSDKGSMNQREDKSGPAIVEILEEAGYEVVETMILPDDQKILEKHLKRLSDQRQVHVILTTGGTGFSMRDVTPEATLAVMTRNAPGIAETIRYESMKYTRRAMLSRGVSVIRNQTLIVNLPGSPKAVKESMEIILDSMKHGIEILIGSASECAR